jgi:hypothetical protein
MHLKGVRDSFEPLAASTSSTCAPSGVSAAGELWSLGALVLGARTGARQIIRLVIAFLHAPSALSRPLTKKTTPQAESRHARLSGGSWGISGVASGPLDVWMNSPESSCAEMRRKCRG